MRTCRGPGWESTAPLRRSYGRPVRGFWPCPWSAPRGAAATLDSARLAGAQPAAVKDQCWACSSNAAILSQNAAPWAALLRNFSQFSVSSRLRVRPTHHHHRATARARGPSGYPPKHSFFGAFPPLQSFVHLSYLFASVCACSFCSWFRHSAPIRPIRVMRVKCGLCAARRGGNVAGVDARSRFGTVPNKSYVFNAIPSDS